MVIATHAKFDLTFFPARKNNKRVRDLFTTLPAKSEESQILNDILEFDTENADETTCTTELVADDTKPPPPHVLPAAVPFSPTESTDIGQIPKMETTHKETQIFQDFESARTAGGEGRGALQWLDAIAWEIDKEYAANLDGIIDMHISSIDPNLPISSSSHNEHLLVPVPDGLDEESSDEEDAVPAPQNPTASEQFAQIETRARAQADSGRQLRSGNVYASSATTQDGVYDASYREFIKTLICNTASPDPADLHEQARNAKKFHMP